MRFRQAAPCQYPRVSNCSAFRGPIPPLVLLLCCACEIRGGPHWHLPVVISLNERFRTTKEEKIRKENAKGESGCPLRDKTNNRYPANKGQITQPRNKRNATDRKKSETKATLVKTKHCKKNGNDGNDSDDNQEKEATKSLRWVTVTDPGSTQPEQ